MALRIIEAVNSLAEFPEIGRPAEKESRELAIVPPYLIRYRIVGETVQILRVRHGARRS